MRPNCCSAENYYGLNPPDSSSCWPVNLYCAGYFHNILSQPPHSCRLYCRLPEEEQHSLCVMSTQWKLSELKTCTASKTRQTQSPCSLHPAVPLETPVATRDVSRETRLWVHNASVSPALLYGAETWPPNKTLADRLDGLDIRALGRSERVKWFHDLSPTLSESRHNNCLHLNLQQCEECAGEAMLPAYPRIIRPVPSETLTWWPRIWGMIMIIKVMMIIIKDSRYLLSLCKHNKQVYFNVLAPLSW